MENHRTKKGHIDQESCSKVASHGFGKVKIILFYAFWCILNLEKSFFDTRRPFSWTAMKNDKKQFKNDEKHILWEKGPKKEHKHKLFRDKKYEHIEKINFSKIGVLTETDVTMSLVAKNYSFWCRRSLFWTHDDPFREHFHFLMIFLKNVRLTSIIKEKVYVPKVCVPFRHLNMKKTNVWEKIVTKLVADYYLWDPIDDFWMFWPCPTRSRRQNFEITLLLSKNEGVICPGKNDNVHKMGRGVSKININ